ncbi:MAG TPA: hypothetical protein VMW69_15540, partial [Spirochaetia bacterium]|nr:hypothetical protein [Spirochaetia bacterium]
MILTERMIHLTAVVLERDSDKATRTLLEEGVLDFVDIHRLPGAWHERISSVRPQAAAGSYSELRKRIETILYQADLVVDAASKLDVKRLAPVSIEQTRQYLDSTNAELQEIRDEQKGAQDEVGRLAEIERQLTLFGDLGATIRAQSRYSFLNLEAGSLPTSQVQPLQSALEGYPLVLLNYESPEAAGDSDRAALLLISLRRDKSALAQITARYDWHTIDLSRQGVQTDGSGGERALKEVRSKIERLKARQGELHDVLLDKITAKRDELETLWANLRMNELYSVIQSNFGRTENTNLFSGWLPESKRASLEEGLHRAVGNRCYLE